MRERTRNWNIVRNGVVDSGLAAIALSVSACENISADGEQTIELDKLMHTASESVDCLDDTRLHYFVKYDSRFEGNYVLSSLALVHEGSRVDTIHQDTRDSVLSSGRIEPEDEVYLTTGQAEEAVRIISADRTQITFACED